MKLVKPYKLITGICLFVSLLMILLIPFFMEKSTTEEVSCYDYYGNMIIGENCIDKGILEPSSSGIILIASGIPLFVVVILIRIFEYNPYDYENYDNSNFFGFVDEDKDEK